MKYKMDVIDDAFEFLRYNHVDIKEAIKDDVSFLGDIQNGSVRDRFNEDFHSRNYTWMEAAEIIENCKNEEEDSTLWCERKIEEAVTICATHSYANDVWEMAQELYDDLINKYEVKFEVVTEDGETISEEFEDDLDADDFIEGLKGKDDLEKTYEFGDGCDAEDFISGLEAKEVSNLEEIWADFIKEYTYVPDVPG